MKLGSLIRNDFILTGDRFKTVQQAADALINLFARREHLPFSAADMRRVVMAREKLGGTVVPPGVALPHGRLPGYEDVLMGMWVPKTPLETPQGTVKLLVLTITSEGSVDIYLKALASIGRAFSQEGYIDTIPGLSAEEMHFRLQEMEIQEEVTISDIMTSNPVTCSPDTTLAELIDLFVGKGVSFLPVVDGDNRPVGEVSVKDVLAAGVPDYARRMGSLEFLKSLEPMEQLARREESLHVADIMHPPSRSLKSGSSIIHAAMLITTKGYRHFPVLEDGKVVGLLSETDIIRKILRGEIWHS